MRGTSAATTVYPFAIHVLPKIGDVETAPVLAVSFRHVRSSQLPMDEPRTPPYQRPLMTIDEAATYLNVPARWVADAVRQHKVRCTRIGKHVRFRVEHLDELVTAGEQPVTSDVIPIQRNRARSKL